MVALLVAVEQGEEGSVILGCAWLVRWAMRNLLLFGDSLVWRESCGDAETWRDVADRACCGIYI